MIENANAPLQHLAIIPDGNRRWAKKQAMALQNNLYQQGADTTMQIIEAAFRLDIPCVTFWGSSYANLQSRAPGFVAALEDVMIKKFEELAVHPLIHEKHVRVEALGQWRELLKPKTIQAIQKALDATAHYSNRLLTVLIGYDGRRERGAAVQDLMHSTPEIPQDELEAEKLLRRFSWTGHLPDVDLIIRTGSWQDPHNSASFLTFLIGESQFCFPELLWPEFTPQHLKKIVHDFAQRERRMGK